MRKNEFLDILDSITRHPITGVTQASGGGWVIWRYDRDNRLMTPCMRIVNGGIAEAIMSIAECICADAEGNGLSAEKYLRDAADIIASIDAAKKGAKKDAAPGGKAADEQAGGER